MRRNLSFPFIVFTLIFLFVSVSNAQLEVPPDLKWKTLRTPHFEVIFNAERQDLGRLYAEKLELAYEKLQPYFTKKPEVTVVIINDKTDITNGYATRIPYPHIMAYPVLPGPEESLADIGDWAYELLVHEYTHILTFEPAGGVMQPLRSIFGTIISPNLLLPSWWKEGVAVEMESRLSHHGRLRSIYQDATLRAMVESQTLHQFDLAEVNEMIPTWPEGMRPYLFGSIMWNQMAQEHGVSIVDDLHDRHGRRVPYFIEQPAQDLLKKSYVDQYNLALHDLNERVQAQIEKLKEIPPTPHVLPKNNFHSVSAPAISPDGKHLALITEDYSASRSIKLITRENIQDSFLDAKMTDTVERFNEAFEPAAQQDGPLTGTIQRVSWFPDSERIIYDKLAYVNRIERYSDLHIYNLTSKKTKALTEGLRAREPSVSPNSERVVFIKLEGGRTSLATLNMAAPKETVDVLLAPPLQERISYPFFWDDKTIIFSWRKADGREHLYRLNIEEKNPQQILAEYPSARFAKKVPQGLLFTSSKNGTHNLYVADSNLNIAKPVSHTLTAFFAADLDTVRNDIFATMMTAQGHRVVTMFPQDWQKTPDRLPEIKSLYAERFANSPTAEEVSKANSLAAEAELTDYQAAGYLWPQYWIPFISGSSSETGIVISAQTSGFDPLKKHTYSLLASWDTALNQGSIQGSYLNQVTHLPMMLTGYKQSSYLGDISNDITDYGVIAAGLPNVFALSRYASLQLGWRYLERSTDTTSVKRTGPTAYFGYANYSQAGAQISPESGLGFYLGATHFIQQNDYLSHSQYLAGGEIYFSRFLPQHNSIMLRLNGLHTPEKIPSLYGAATESLVFVPDSPAPQYIFRGYKRGQIYGRNLATLNAEYRFPIKNIYAGSGTDPLFLRRLSGAFVVDGAAADGVLLLEESSPGYQMIRMNHQFWSAGVEAKLETTLGYLFPVNIVIGYYAPLNSPDGNSGMINTTLQIPGF